MRFPLSPTPTERIRSVALGAALTLGLHAALLEALTHEYAVGMRARPVQPSPGPMLIVRLLPETSTQTESPELPTGLLVFDQPPPVLAAELQTPTASEPQPVVPHLPAWTDPAVLEPPAPGLTDQRQAWDLTQPGTPVDRPALPITEPDLASLLAGFTATGQPIHLRLRISAKGEVLEAQVIEASPEDAILAQALADKLRQTPHVPARHDGRDVASVKEVWVELAPKLTRELLF